MIEDDLNLYIFGKHPTDDRVDVANPDGDVIQGVTKEQAAMLIAWADRMRAVASQSITAYRTQINLTKLALADVERLKALAASNTKGFGEGVNNAYINGMERAKEIADEHGVCHGDGDNCTTCQITAAISSEISKLP